MRLIASPDANSSLIKRSRIVGTQSKYGCFTCKSRRIKCDETKPECSRCQRSNVRCEGYPLRACSETKDSRYPHSSASDASDSPETQLDAVSTEETQPTFALLDGFRRSPVQERLARLGCSVLRDGLQDQFEVSRTVFEWLLPQLSHALPSVNAAAAALGAVYEMQTATPSSLDSKKLLVVAQYGAAVRGVQHELCNRPYGAVPILMACVLLACADVLLCRMRVALMHIRGAIRLLEERNALSTVTSVSRPTVAFAATNEDTASGADSLALEEEDDNLTVFFRTLDVQTVLYADGLPPEMHIAFVRPPQHTGSSPPCIHRTGRELIALMQACYCFTSNACKYTHRPRIFVPTDLPIEQGRHIAALKLWLRRLDYDLMPSIKASACSTSTALSKYTHCLMLRNLCLSAIIYASKILNPYETGWDAYAREFHEIVTGAELILEHRVHKRPRALSTSTSAFTFTPAPGIIHPLYLTVLKCRHPRWRRRALQVLRQCGKEGPWDGRLMAAAAQCAIGVEESELVVERSSSLGVEQADGFTDAGKGLLGVIVPEHVRISGCGLDNGTDGGEVFDWEWLKEWEFTSHQGAMGRLKVSRVRFSRCKDVHRMLVAGLNGQIPEDNASWLDEHWERWTETVEL